MPKGICNFITALSQTNITNMTHITQYNGASGVLYTKSSWVSTGLAFQQTTQPDGTSSGSSKPELVGH